MAMIAGMAESRKSKADVGEVNQYGGFVITVMVPKKLRVGQGGKRSDGTRGKSFLKEGQRDTRSGRVHGNTN